MDKPKLFGLLEPGNVDYLKRPVVRHTGENVKKYGNYSTTYSASFQDDTGKEVLIPTVSHDGRMMGRDEAIQYYHQTGEHLGKYDTPDNADKSATNIHNYQAQFYSNDGTPKPGMGAVDTLPGSTRLTPFQEMYPTWNQPTFNIESTFLKPVKPTPGGVNRSTMGRVYENVLNGFSEVRQRELQQKLDALKDLPTAAPPSVQTWGGNG